MEQLPQTRITFLAMAKQAVTIYDIAHLAKVSQSTVSRVLNGSARVAPERRAAVLAAVQQLRYKPNVVARGLARGRSSTFGVLTLDQASPFYGQIVTGIERGLRGTGYHALIASVSGSQDAGQALDLLLASRVDTLIIVGEPVRDDRLVRIAHEIPVAAVGPSMRGIEDRCLHADNQAGAHAATWHLLSSGHTRIAYIGGRTGHRHTIDRLEGYRRALAEAGRTVDPSLLLDGAFDEDSGLRATEKLLASGTKFSAIFAANDPMAYGALLALHRRGLRVPQDVSVVGFDDQPHSAHTTPPLTTVRQPLLDMGAAAARLLIGALAGEPWRVPTFKTELVVRESTAPAAGSAARAPSR
jgi:LacI family transcriptional regulator